MNEPSKGVSWLHRFAALIAVLAFFLAVFGTPAVQSRGRRQAPAANAMRLPAKGTPAAHRGAHSALLKDPLNATPSPLQSPDGPDRAAYKWSVLSVGVLTLILAVWLSRANARRYIKGFGWLAVLGIAGLALLDGNGVLAGHPAAATVAQGVAAETFFCLAVCLALFTRTDWHWGGSGVADLKQPSFRALSVVVAAVLFAEPVLGDFFSAGSFRMAPHLVVGMALFACVLWMLEMVFNEFPAVAGLKIPTVLLAELVGLAFFVGLIAYGIELEARRTAGTHPGLVILSATHAALGTLALAAGLYVTFQAFKHLASLEESSTIAK